MKFLNYGVPTTSVVLSRTLVRASFNLDRKQTKRDEDEIVRRTAVEELARGWKDDPDTLSEQLARPSERSWDSSSLFAARLGLYALADGGCVHAEGLGECLQTFCLAAVELADR